MPESVVFEVGSVLTYIIVARRRYVSVFAVRKVHAVRRGFFTTRRVFVATRAVVVAIGRVFAIRIVIVAIRTVIIAIRTVFARKVFVTINLNIRFRREWVRVAGTSRSSFA